MKAHLLALWLCLAPVAATAQAEGEGPAETVQTMADCWNRRDVDCLIAHVTDDLIYTNALGSHWRGKAAARQGWVALLASPEAAYPQIDERIVRFAGPDSAIVWESGWIRDVKALDGRPLPPIRTFMTTFLVRRDGQWLLAAGHSSVDAMQRPE